MKGVPRTNSRFPMRGRVGHRGNRKHLAPATTSPPASEVCHPGQLLQICFITAQESAQGLKAAAP
eukprot:1161617-Pelagomonas_calceolata.AAC.4